MIVVDPLMGCVRNRNWPYDESCHLMCDPGEVDQLHAFAAGIGLKRSWFQNSANGTPHYDLTPGKRRQAVVAGAAEVDREGCVAIIRAWREHKRPGSQQRLLEFLSSPRSPK